MKRKFTHGDLALLILHRLGRDLTPEQKARVRELLESVRKI